MCTDATMCKWSETICVLTLQSDFFISACVLQFKDAARQVDADEIADVLEEQAADAEDAAAAEELDAETTAAMKTQAAAKQQKLASDADAKSASKDPAVVASQGVGRMGEETHPVVNAEGATKDVHEADLDMSHADSAPGIVMCLSSVRSGRKHC